MAFNQPFIEVLDKLREYYQTKGSFMKARAYEKARDSLILHRTDITSLDQLQGIPNVGKSTIGKLKEYMETKSVKVLDDALNDPEIMFSKVYGIGPKKAKELVEKHQVTTIKELRSKQDDLLNDVQKKGLKYYEDILKRIPRPEIDEYLKHMTVLFEKVKAANPTSANSTLDIVGSYRRGKLESGDIDIIICNENDDNKVFNDFLDLMIENKLLIEVLSRGNIKSLGVAKLGNHPARRVDFMFTPRRENAFAILYFTGSKEFNTAMRSHALTKGYSLNEHGLYKMENKKKGEKLTQLFKTEKDVFDFLGLEYVAPENRKGANSMIIKKDAGVVKSSVKKTLKKQSRCKSQQKPSARKQTLKKSTGDGKKKGSVKTQELISLFKENGLNHLKTLSEKELASMIVLADKQYYSNDKPLMTDSQYDLLKEYVEELYPNNKAIQNGHKACDVAVDKKKVDLPYEMWSMDKIKSEKQINNKLKKHTGPYIVSAKMDGISVLYYSEDKYKDSPQLYTRGNGKKGQDITYLLPYLNLPVIPDVTIRGELIIKKKLFQDKYAEQFSNPRNFVSGLANSKKLTDDLKKMVGDLTFIAYEVIHPVMKGSDQMRFLEENWGKHNTVKYELMDTINKEVMSEYLMDWRENYEYEIDGIIVSQDGIFKRQSKNPDHAFAFKMVLSDQMVEARVVDVLWAPSKDGYLKPRVKIMPVVIGGATIEYATCHNADFVKKNGIGVGAVVQLIRSGDVIPKVHKMIHKTTPKFPTNYNYVWTKGNVDIKLSDEDIKENDIVKIKRIEEFFKKLEVVGMGYKNVEKLYDAGYNTIEKFVKMEIDNIKQLPGMGTTSAKKIVDSIKERLEKVELYVMMGASPCFGRGIGEKRLKELLIHYPFVLSSKSSDDVKISKISSLKGFDTKTAKQIVPYIDDFKRFANKLGVLYKLYSFKTSKAETAHPLKDKKIVVTGPRDKEFMEKVKKIGIPLTTSVSKNTDFVLVTSMSEETGKTAKAKSLNITIMTTKDFTEKYLQ